MEKKKAEMSVSEMIEAKNHLMEKLDVNNRRYYTDLLMYLRSSSISKDEKKVEEVSLDILNDILDAQNDGISAEESLGNNPREYLDEILKTLEPSRRNLLEVFSIAFIAAFLVTFIPDILGKSMIDMGQILMISLIIALAALLTFSSLASTVYSMNKTRYINPFLIMLLCLSATVLIRLYIHTPLIINRF